MTKIVGLLLFLSHVAQAGGEAGNVSLTEKGRPVRTSLELCRVKKSWESFESQEAKKNPTYIEYFKRFESFYPLLAEQIKKTQSQTTVCETYENINKLFPGNGFTDTTWAALFEDRDRNSFQFILNRRKFDQSVSSDERAVHLIAEFLAPKMSFFSGSPFVQQFSETLQTQSQYKELAAILYRAGLIDPKADINICEKDLRTCQATYRILHLIDPMDSFWKDFRLLKKRGYRVSRGFLENEHEKQIKDGLKIPIETLEFIVAHLPIRTDFEAEWDMAIAHLNARLRSTKSGDFLGALRTTVLYRGLGQGIKSFLGTHGEATEKNKVEKKSMNPSESVESEQISRIPDSGCPLQTKQKTWAEFQESEVAKNPQYGEFFRRLEVFYPPFFIWIENIGSKVIVCETNEDLNKIAPEYAIPEQRLGLWIPERRPIRTVKDLEFEGGGTFRLLLSRPNFDSSTIPEYERAAAIITEFSHAIFYEIESTSRARDFYKSEFISQLYKTIETNSQYNKLAVIMFQLGIIKPQRDILMCAISLQACQKTYQVLHLIDPSDSFWQDFRPLDEFDSFLRERGVSENYHPLLWDIGLPRNRLMLIEESNTRRQIGRNMPVDALEFVVSRIPATEEFGETWFILGDLLERRIRTSGDMNTIARLKGIVTENKMFWEPYRSSQAPASEALKSIAEKAKWEWRLGNYQESNRLMHILSKEDRLKISICSDFDQAKEHTNQFLNYYKMQPCDYR